MNHDHDPYPTLVFIILAGVTMFFAAGCYLIVENSDRSDVLIRGSVLFLACLLIAGLSLRWANVRYK